MSLQEQTQSNPNVQRVVSQHVAEPEPGLWSNCLRAGNQIFISGMVAVGPDGVVGVDDPGAQARHIFDAIKNLMIAAGGQMSGVVTLTIYVTDMKHRPAVLEARRQYFSGDFPCSTLIEVTALINPKMLVEISAVGVI